MVMRENGRAVAQPKTEPNGGANGETRAPSDGPSVADAPEALFVCDLGGRVLDVNRAFLELGGLPEQSLAFPPKLQTLGLGWLRDSMEQRVARVASGVRRPVRAELTRPDGAVIPVELRFGLWEGGDERRLIVAVRDVSRERLQEIQLLGRLSLERALRDATFALLASGADDLGLLLRPLGTALEASRAMVVRHTGPDDTCTLVASWTAFAIDAGKLAFPVHRPVDLGWWCERLATDGEVVLPEVDTLPDAADELRGQLDGSGTRALIAAAIQGQEGLQGFLLFDDVHRPRAWNEEQRMAVAAAARTIGAHWRESTDRREMSEREALFRRVMEGSPDIALLCDESGRVTGANRHAHASLGAAPGALAGRMFASLTPEPPPEGGTGLPTELAHGLPVRKELTLVRRDGSRFPAEARFALIAGESQHLVLMTARDVTDRKMLEAELRGTNSELRSWVQVLERRSRDLARVNELGELLQVCRTPDEAYSVFARTAETLFGETSGAVYLLAEQGELAECVASWGPPTLQNEEFEQNDCWALRRGRLHVGSDGEVRCDHLGPHGGDAYRCAPLVAQGETIGVLHVRDTRRDVPSASPTLAGKLREARERLVVTAADHFALAISNLRLRERLRSQAIRDPLTGLFNRRYLEECLHRELQRSIRRGAPLGVMMLDIDHFKQVNDNHGHAAGDAVLRHFGEFLLGQVRGEDLACRYGGEEFVLLLLDSTLEHTLTRAEQLRQGVRELRLSHGPKPLPSIAVSVGVAAVPEHGSSSEAVMGAADSALYAAKRSGRDCVKVAHHRRS